MTRLLSVDEALRCVLDHARPLPPVTVPLQDARGCVLAQDVVSDIDSPPHDKSVVDGFAVRTADITAEGAELEVIEEITAGMIPRQALAPGQAARIMTGAPLPQGADAVVMVEKTRGPGTVGSKVWITEHPLRSGQNIMRRAASMQCGQRVLAAGTCLRAIECGLLAEAGCSEVRVIPRPRVAVLATGNELVPHTQRPGPGQIRNSNGPLLQALVQESGGTIVSSAMVPDVPQPLRDAIASGLNHDVLLISGGVSAGVLDLVPSILSDLGVQPVFHKVNIKPGKPLWFGTGTTGACGGGRCLVFGLPGNPVSTLVSFLLFVRPALAVLAGRPARGLPRREGVLAQPFRQHGDRPTYWPATLREGGSEPDRGLERSPLVIPLRWEGSGDLCTLAHAEGLAVFPAGEREYPRGSPVTVLMFESERSREHA